MSSNLFSELIQTYPTWDALSAYLKSPEGGNLAVQTTSSSDPTNLAIIRYIKGQSNMLLPHTGAFRSVVWNTGTNRPVSVTAFKSEVGEVFPNFEVFNNLQVEEFVDGVMIGQFWDANTQTWRIHTRSTMDGQCRYFSKRSFAELFSESVQATFGSTESLEQALEKDVTYTWILSHPENRIVCPVKAPKLTLVTSIHVNEDASVEILSRETVTGTSLAGTLPRVYMSRTLPSPAESDVIRTAALLMMMNNSDQQGIVFKTESEPFKRWKSRCIAYNTVRKLRGNTARRDFHWMDLWSKGELAEYLKHYSEEQADSAQLINRWKNTTQETYNLYVDAFKARTLNRADIPAKFRPFVYGLHNHYLNVLKPSRKSLGWREAVQYMNNRDTALKIFGLNWELRKQKTLLPFEPLPTSASTKAVEFPTEADSQPLEEGEVRE